MKLLGGSALLVLTAVVLAGCTQVTDGSGSPLLGSGGNGATDFPSPTASGGGNTRSATPTSTADTFTVTGTLTLYTDFSSADEVSGERCEGTGDYTDVVIGAEMDVVDGSGDTLGSGTISTSRSDYKADPTECVFSFTVEDVPEGEDTYSFMLGTRGAEDYTEAEMKDDPQLTLNS